MPVHPCPSTNFNVGTGTARGLGSGPTVRAAVSAAKARAASNALVDADRAIRNHTCQKNCDCIGRLTWASPGIRTYVTVVRAFPVSRRRFRAVAFVRWKAKGDCLALPAMQELFGLTPPTILPGSPYPWLVPAD
jgi:hypothetical protein